MLATPQVAWPVKTREMHNHHMNSEIWNDWEFRDGDVVVATYGKSGTTWMQQIVAQLIFNGAEGIEVPKLSPWLDLRIMPPEAIAAVRAQAHRRSVKTHLPVDALVFSPKAKYIYIGRDGRDALWSLYNHHAKANDMWFGAINGAPGRVGPEIGPANPSIHDYYREWFAKDGHPFWPFWENVRSWWAIRDLRNVKLVHFNDLKADLAGSIRDIARFIEIDIDEDKFPSIVHHCTFDYMKQNAPAVTPLGGALWEGGAATFINKGTNNRWRDTLTDAEIRAYEARAEKELGKPCADWLTGKN
jgi:aryl sulfotransferase